MKYDFIYLIKLKIPSSRAEYFSNPIFFNSSVTLSIFKIRVQEKEIMFVAFIKDIFLV